MFGHIRRYNTALVSASALLTLLLGCGDGVPPTESERPDEALVNSAIEAALEQGESGVVMMLASKRCEDMGETKGVLEIKGVAGNSARLELSCGGTVYDNCTALIAPGSTSAKCETTDQIPLGRGHFACSQKIVDGNPSAASSCY